jgi:hypothetical protein
MQELIEIANRLRATHGRGEDLGLTEDELAFYDALETNDSTVAVLGDENLKTIARELVETVRRNATVDWTLREDTRANMRRMVKRILRRHGYRRTRSRPPPRPFWSRRSLWTAREPRHEGLVTARKLEIGTREWARRSPPFRLVRAAHRARRELDSQGRERPWTTERQMAILPATEEIAASVPG